MRTIIQHRINLVKNIKQLRIKLLLENTSESFQWDPFSPFNLSSLFFFAVFVRCYYLRIWLYKPSIAYPYRRLFAVLSLYWPVLQYNTIQYNTIQIAFIWAVPKFGTDHGNCNTAWLQRRCNITVLRWLLKYCRVQLWF